MSSLYFVFWFAQMCIGAIVGSSTTKRSMSPWAGLRITLLLGKLAIVELIVVSELRDPRRPAGLVGFVVATLALGFALWGICLLFACIGYWLADSLLAYTGFAGWQVGTPTLVALATVFTVVAAIGRLM